MEYPSATITDLMLNAMHDAIERAREALRHAPNTVDTREFSLTLSQPRDIQTFSGNPTYHCEATLTFQPCITC